MLGDASIGSSGGHGCGHSGKVHCNKHPSIFPMGWEKQNPLKECTIYTPQHDRYAYIQPKRKHILHTYKQIYTRKARAVYS